MNWIDLFSALALVLVIEGLMPFINPRGYKNTMQQMMGLPDKTLRWVGLSSMIIGLILLTLIRS